MADIDAEPETDVALLDLDLRLLEYIDRFLTDQGFAPTYREMAAALGVASTATVTRSLQRLAAAGRVSWQPRQGRTLRTTP